MVPECLLDKQDSDWKIEKRGERERVCVCEEDAVHHAAHFL